MRGVRGIHRGSWVAHPTFRPPSTFTVQEVWVSALRDGRLWKGGTYAILRHIVCESGGRRRVEGKGCRGGWGEGRGDRMGLNTHVAKFPTEFIEGRGSGHRRREKEALGGRVVASVSLRLLRLFLFFSFFFRAMGQIDAVDRFAYTQLRRRRRRPRNPQNRPPIFPYFREDAYGYRQPCLG